MVGIDLTLHRPRCPEPPGQFGLADCRNGDAHSKQNLVLSGFSFSYLEQRIA
jgi:hypothetical protein